MVHAFPPFHSLDILSLACSFRWPYDTKGIVKHRTLMYITNTLQLEWRLGPFPPFFCVCRRLRTLFLSFLLSSQLRTRRTVTRTCVSPLVSTLISPSYLGTLSLCLNSPAPLNGASARSHSVSLCHSNHLWKDDTRFATNGHTHIELFPLPYCTSIH